jgi:hypothetical protein
MKILTLITQFRQSCAGGHFISAKVDDDNDGNGVSAMEAMCLVCNEVYTATAIYIYILLLSVAAICCCSRRIAYTR